MQETWNPYGWYNLNAIFYVVILGLVFTAPFWMVGLWKIYALWRKRGVLQKREQAKEEKRQKRESRKSRKRKRK